MNTKVYISVLAVVAVLVGLLFFIKRAPDGTAPPKTPPVIRPLDLKAVQAHWSDLLSVAAAPPLGNPKAPYTIIECGDFQCPNCGACAPILESIVKGSNGKAKMYFINFPIPAIHPHAMLAAQAGLSAAKQGKFWEMYDMLYQNQDQLIPSEIEYNARSISGIDSKQVAADMAANAYNDFLAKSHNTLEKLGITSVPCILVRKGDGPVSVYLGTKGQDSYKGVYYFASSAEWMNDDQKQAGAQAVASEEQKLKDEESGDSSE